MYEKQNWKTGDVITQEKLNHMEDGIASAIANAGAVLIVNANENGTLDKTWQEIHDAPLAVIKFIPDDNQISTGIVVTTSISGGDYNVEDNGGTIYTADSAEGYPANSIG